ncbi:hypothetical protein GGG16DRAFT_11550, partial [Schizophyllum commune]
MAFTLLSVSKLDRAGCRIKIEGGIFTIAQVAAATTPKISITELHNRMGHKHHDALKRMVVEGRVTGINLDMDSKPEFCVGCLEGKAKKKSFPQVGTYEDVKAYGDKVVCDLQGP